MVGSCWWGEVPLSSSLVQQIKCQPWKIIYLLQPTGFLSISFLYIYIHQRVFLFMSLTASSIDIFLSSLFHLLSHSFLQYIPLFVHGSTVLCFKTQQRFLSYPIVFFFLSCSFFSTTKSIFSQYWLHLLRLLQWFRLA
jgi:hypothetical protein